MSQRFKAVLFDMDGLMVDTERLYIQANQILAQRYGKQVTDATIARMMGRSTVESLGIYAQDLGISAPAEHLAGERSEIMLQLIAADLVVMPGTREILAYLRPLYRLGLATGSAAVLMSHILQRIALAGYFDVTQSSDGIALGKPNPDIHLQTCRRLNVPPQECIVLEDSSNGVRAGAAAGCYVIAVPNEHTLHHDLSASHIRVSDLHQALHHIRSLAPKPDPLTV